MSSGALGIRMSRAEPDPLAGEETRETQQAQVDLEGLLGMVG